MKDSITSHGNGGMSFTGKGVDVFRAQAIASALNFYVKTGMKVNSAYTPKAMMTMAAHITGKTYKARDYTLAANDLKEYANKLALVIAVQ